MRSRPRPRPPSPPAATAPPSPLASVCVGAATLVLYLALAPAYAGDKDSSEFTLVLARLGSAHPTGYPLYTLLGHAFVRLAHAAGVGWNRAANAWSAVGGALAMGLLHALSSRLLSREGVAARPAVALALLPVAAIALNPIVTIETTLAEVNAFHLAVVAGTMLALLAAMGGLGTADVRGDVRRFAGMGMVAGLGLSHHATSVFVLAPAGIALLAEARSTRRLRPAVIAAAAIGLAVPLASYGWIAWRAFHPVDPQWPSLDATWHSVWRHVTGAEYRTYLGRSAPSEVQRAGLAHYLWPWFAPLAAGTLVWAWRGRGTPAGVRAAWVATMLIATGVASFYGVHDPSSYYLPPLLLASAAAPAALIHLAPLRRHARVVTALAGLALVAQSARWFTIARERGEFYGRFDRKVRSMWNAVPFDSGFVLWPNDMVCRLRKYQLLDGEKPGIEALHPVALTADGARKAFIRRHGFDPADPGRLEARIRAHPKSQPTYMLAVAQAIAEEIDARSRLPVVIFRPEVPELRLLDKPRADTIGVGGPAKGP